MKLKTLIENLKYYKSKGSTEVTLDIDDLLKALNDVSNVEEVKPKKSMAMDVFAESSSKDKVQNVGIFFMKFCNKWNMPKLTESATEFGEILNACQKQ